MLVELKLRGKAAFALLRGLFSLARYIHLDNFNIEYPAAPCTKNNLY